MIIKELSQLNEQKKKLTYSETA